MNRFFVIALLVLCSVLSCNALRGALFRSGRSGIRNRPLSLQQQNLYDYMIPQKRSVAVVSHDNDIPTLQEIEQLPVFYAQFQ